MKKFFSITLFIIILLPVLTNVSNAQDTTATPVPVAKSSSTSRMPMEGEFGIGGMLGSGSTNRVGFGPAFSYALLYNIHIYGMLSFYATFGGDRALTYLTFMPGVKYFLQGDKAIRHFRPFLLGSFIVSSTAVNYKDEFQRDQVRTETGTGIVASIGGSWFPVSGVQLDAGLHVVEFQFSETSSGFGSNNKFMVGLGPIFMSLIWYL